MAQNSAVKSETKDRLAPASSIERRQMTLQAWKSKESQTGSCGKPSGLHLFTSRRGSRDDDWTGAVMSSARAGKARNAKIR